MKEYIMTENGKIVAITTAKVVEESGGLEFFKNLQKTLFNREVHEAVSYEQKEKEEKSQMEGV